MALPRDPGSGPALALSLLVHVLLFVFLVFGVHWVSKPPEAVVVELWNQPTTPEPIAEPAPKPEPPPPEPKVEVKPQKPDIVIEKEKKTPPKKEPPKKEPPLKLSRPDFNEQYAREMAQLNAKNRTPAPPRTGAPAAGPLGDPKYTDMIKHKIKSNVVLPPDIAGNPEAIFDVVQLPTGEVISVKLKKSSGHRGYDDALERAILKSSPLPRPERPEQFRRELELKFRPQEQ